MKDFDHPNLPKIYEYYVDEINIHIVLEYIDGNELFDHII